MRYAKKLRQTCPRWSSWKTSMNSTSCKSAQMLMLRSLKQDASIPTSSWQNYGYFLHFLTISVSLYASCFITCSVKFIDSIALIITLYTPITHPPHQGMKGGVLGDLGLYGWVSNLLQDSMFGGSQSAAGMTCEGYWKQLTIAFKYLLISTLALTVVGLFTPNLVYLLANVMQQTVNHIQIWRLVTSFLANISLISLLFDLLIMSSFLPDLERRYSTAYMLAEIIIQNLYCNVVFVLLGEALSLVGLINSTGLATYGLTNVMLIFLWQRVSLNPQEMTRLWCLPCIMPMAYLPWCFMAILLIQGCLLGYYQHMILKRSLFVLPIRLYNSIQSCLPLKMKKQQGFISVSAAEGNIQANSLASSYSRANAPPDSNELMSEVVSSGGVPIGGSQTQSSGNYRQHWLEQEEPQQQTGDDTTRALYPQVQLEESSHAINGIPRHNQANNELL